MSFLRLLTIIPYHPRFVIMLAFIKMLHSNVSLFLSSHVAASSKTKPSTSSFVSISSSESVSSASISIFISISIFFPALYLFLYQSESVFLANLSIRSKRR